jgi:hypothetical protein
LRKRVFKGITVCSDFITGLAARQLLPVEGEKAALNCREAAADRRARFQGFAGFKGKGKCNIPAQATEA